MVHKPIQIQDISLAWPHKTCFETFSSRIQYGDKIAITGRNGAGKSSLLKMLHGNAKPTDGDIRMADDACPAYLPQIIEDFLESSGGQRLNRMLTSLLATNPNLLLLDEPTNHLDSRNRRSLIRMLQHYPGTLIIVSHDIELINATSNILWHIDPPAIDVFSGSYHEYQLELARKRESINHELSRLAKQKKDIHQTLLKEQERNKNSRIRGEKHIEQRKWPTIRSHAKLASAVTTGDKRLAKINEHKHQLLIQQSMLHMPEVIRATFKLQSTDYHKPLVTIQDASISYSNGPTILENFNLHLAAQERIAICGDNGSGKSTLIKAILNMPSLSKTGSWVVPHPADVGYLDQHYQHLAMDKTVIEQMTMAMPKVPYSEVRAHLNDFLFRKNEEVQTLIKDLSGGEKARFSLALIAANPPRLLILDELTNNLDLETRAHIIQVLSEFPGAIITISHDEDFLTAIRIETRYQISQRKLL